MTIGLPWPLNRWYSPPADDEDQGFDAVLHDVKEPVSTSLIHYATPGKSPPSARVDSKLKAQQRRPVRLWHMWKYGLVAASKATEITSELIYMAIWGPRKKSWGIEMTIITSLMRGAGRHSHLVDITTIRTLMSIGGLVPLPSDALITPVTFRVRKRNLRGLLAPLDAAETGFRELSGEWVVGKKTWQRLQAEWKAAQTSPTKSENFDSTKKTERVVLYIHGGAYYLSSAAAQRLISIPLAKYTDARVFALDYRLAPETKFPGPLHDVVLCYFRLTEDLHIPAENIIVSGDSAGGGLILALLMYLRDNNYPLPSAAILMSPWVDLTMSCESWDSNAPFDVVPIPALDNHMHPVMLYLGDKVEEYLTHPYASPLFGDFTGLPPMLVQSGDAEVLRDEITLMAHKATLAGVHVRHELYEDAVHVFQLYPFLTAASRSFMSMRDFVHNILPQIQRRSPQRLDLQAERVLENEIVSEGACVVRGDGVEVATGKNEVQEELQEFGTPDGSDSDEDQKTPKEYPSWGHSPSWSLSAEENSDTDSSDDTSDDEQTTGTIPPSPSRARHRMDPPATPVNGFRRIRSAFSLLMTEQPSPSTQSGRRHRRTATTHLQFPILADSPQPIAPIHDRKRAATVTERPVAINLPPANIVNLRSMPPSPSVRRSSNASSHPDITDLVTNWTNQGPANRTLVYSPTL